VFVQILAQPQEHRIDTETAFLLQEIENFQASADYDNEELELGKGKQEKREKEKASGPKKRGTAAAARKKRGPKRRSLGGASRGFIVLFLLYFILS
jgi:hypothetical protein